MNNSTNKIICTESNAIFNKAGDHRYALIRTWDESKPKVMFIGLNPSTASETKNDNTITKVIKIANNNGFGGLYMLNLFSFITAHPKEIKYCELSNQINGEQLTKYSQLSKAIVFCWGNFKPAQLRQSVVVDMFPNSHCLWKNKNGSPKHPLYCLDDQQIIPYQ